MVLMPLEGDVLVRDMSEAGIKESLAQYVVIVVARTPASTAAHPCRPAYTCTFPEIMPLRHGAIELWAWSANEIE